MKLLHIDSSILGGYSASRQLSAATVAKLQSGHSDVAVTYRDLAAEPLAHLSGAHLAAQQNPTGDQSPELAAELATSATVLQEFLDADTVVIGVALYNFTIPTQLKAWIDRVLLAGKTFRYNAQGVPEGLAGNKRVILLVARGGFYGAGSPMASLEHAESYMRTALGFVGVHAPEVIVAEGLATGADARQAGIASAQQQIDALAA
ncbi:FMN-dependent NADH-azoreductase [Xanthomonas hortorum]|uniref:FMN-dependent NADH-azoreductase n=1 Tax=Xanthomonas hortorum TaxID=56454 RepID=UPI0015D6033A|nr:NAD(P)H-dependent oxidoreductase [Xanthomonas hortorum]MCE4358191.1 NAD(P)H-dependent oxidoreductase [Xanthomonas hortorum pv. taraxaci]NMI52841.1 FMN-dependent NADH-azoreductase [Xanthomonas hortorum pv. taraxaci]CAD0298219.1 FMN-dependent NADH-azoreductase 1 [Xanthomonas hortorum pv. taraxaci]CAD0298224.1 FMN-dependent NADH-azoreductase 1 [Xanthomonas hortorum pv. taraxaci]